MAKVMAIPKKFLVHNIQVIDQVTQATQGIGKVLVQLSRGLSYTESGEEVVAKSYLYIDIKNSVYTDLSIVKDNNIVVFKGKRYIIKLVNYEVAFADHHLEVLLM